MAEVLRDGWAFYRARLAAAKEGRVCEHDCAIGAARAAEPAPRAPRTDDDAFGRFYWGFCGVLAYVIVVSVAFAAHPLLGLLFLWLGLYIAPILAGLLGILIPLALAGAVILAGVVLLIIRFG